VDASARAVRAAAEAGAQLLVVHHGISWGGGIRRLSGGAGEFAEEAKRLGCDLFITGEASWGDVIAAENCSIPMLCAGHYETEVYGVRAVSAALHKALKLPIRDLT